MSASVPFGIACCTTTLFTCSGLCASIPHLPKSYSDFIITYIPTNHVSWICPNPFFCITGFFHVHRCAWAAHIKILDFVYLCAHISLSAQCGMTKAVTNHAYLKNIKKLWIIYHTPLQDTSWFLSNGFKHTHNTYIISRIIHICVRIGFERTQGLAAIAAVHGIHI